ncbi:uncharacterized protein LOC123671740 [Harmonia axyridis]|uniref:uncharacterized protein LOC123671740 n=1 Tax=Harmonia axyridis TaxID=115357 RepID=UPI001E2777F0|nr:uncharacterized protein LOC123671740 [Harmonia axyridis]
MINIYRAIQNSQSFIWNGFFHSVRLLKYSSSSCKKLPPIASVIHKSQTSNIRNTLNPSLLTCMKFKNTPSLTISRKIHLTRSISVPRTPDLIYFPDVLRWLKTKVKFKYLRNVWDPSFSEGAFIYGSTHAICRITEIINNNKVAEFEGLLTAPARIKLIEDMTKKLTRTQREIIRLHPRDIKILVPMSVDLSKTGLGKECKVLMRVLALKWFPQRSGYLRLVLVALQSEFTKDYTHGIDQDWNISSFDVMECTVLTETPSNTL